MGEMGSPSDKILTGMFVFYTGSVSCRAWTNGKKMSASDPPQWLMNTDVIKVFKSRDKARRSRSPRL